MFGGEAKDSFGLTPELGELRHDYNEIKQLLVHLSKENQKQLIDEFLLKTGNKAAFMSCKQIE
jgi:hypothetical protein